jgi:hypothetical protein
MFPTKQQRRAVEHFKKMAAKEEGALVVVKYNPEHKLIYVVEHEHWGWTKWRIWPDGVAAPVQSVLR